MTFNENVMRMIRYGTETGLLPAEEIVFAINQILDVFHEEDYISPELPPGEICLEEILKELLDEAVRRELLTADSPVYRDLFDARIMNCLIPRPSQISTKFWNYYEESPVKATDYFYKLSQDSDYIRRYRIEKDIHWQVESTYGKMDITINLSKPEKDPRAIAAAAHKKLKSYPKCLLCVENVGYAGSISHPARENHRIIPITINGTQWAFQYSPYVYYNEHCIVINGRHIPMQIERNTFVKLFDFIKLFPHYFLGSNADLPIVGGSILSHDHYQGGNYSFAMAKAKIEIPVTIPAYEDVEAGIVKWPLSVLRIRSHDETRLIDLATYVLKQWRGYSDETVGILAQTGEVPHNTITPIARKHNHCFELDLTLRNNRVDEKHPFGIFHPHEDKHHIKKENIGLIEVMGLAILPARLKDQLDWLPGDTERERFKAEIGRIFVGVLEDAGVYKCSQQGRAAFLRFIKTL